MARLSAVLVVIGLLISVLVHLTSSKVLPKLVHGSSHHSGTGNKYPHKNLTSCHNFTFTHISSVKRSRKGKKSTREKTQLTGKSVSHVSKDTNLINGLQNDRYTESHGYDYDLIVLGGGSGGLACAKEAQVNSHNNPDVQTNLTHFLSNHLSHVLAFKP